MCGMRDVPRGKWRSDAEETGWTRGTGKISWKSKKSKPDRPARAGREVVCSVTILLLPRLAPITSQSHRSPHCLRTRTTSKSFRDAAPVPEDLGTLDRETGTSVICFSLTPVEPRQAIPTIAAAVGLLPKLDTMVPYL
jgi:hypothetical protein